MIVPPISVEVSRSSRATSGPELEPPMHLSLMKREITRNQSENLDVELGASNRWNFGVASFREGWLYFLCGKDSQISVD